MNLKKVVLVVLIVLAGIVTIDQFIFPKIAENCDCVVGFEIGTILCQETCQGFEDCYFTKPIYGYCSDGHCVSWGRVYCFGLTHSSTTYVWLEPCWNCTQS